MVRNISEIKRKYKLYYFIYFLIFLEFVWITAYYFSPAGKARMHSDLTTGIQLMEQVLHEKTLYPKNWIYTNTISLPITMASMVLLYKITGNYITALLLNFAGYILFMAASVRYFTKHVMKMSNTLTAVSIFIFLSPGSLEYFNTVFYSGYSFRIAVFLLLLGMGLQCVKNSGLEFNRKYIFLYMALICLFVIGDIRYAATIILPLITAMAISYFIKNGQDDIHNIMLPIRRFFIYCMCVGAALFVCIAVEKYLKSSLTFVEGFYSATLVSDLSDMWKNLKSMINAYVEVFGFASGAPQMSVQSVLSLCGLVFAAYIIIINPILMLLRYKKLPFLMQQLILYRWIGYAVTIYFWIFTNGIAFRHALTFMVLDCLLAVYFLSDTILQDGKTVQVFGCVVMVFYMVFNWSHASWLDISAQWNSTYEVLDNRKQMIEEIERRGLEYGYASFWNASITAAFSQGKLKIYPWNLYDRYQWYAPKQLYLPAEKSEPTFLLMPTEEYESYLEEEDFEKFWGDYSEKVEQAGHVLLIYDYNIATNFREFCSYSKNLLKYMAIAENNTYQTMQPSSEKGHKESVILLEPQEYIFGPYVNLEYGAYTLHVETSGKSYLNAYAMSETEEKTGFICQAELKEGINQVPFYLLSDTDRVEFHITNTDDCRIELRRLSLERGEDYSLLNQMHLSKISEKNNANTIYLPPGEVLFGPYAEVDKGSYLLRVTVSDPVTIHIWTQSGEHVLLQQELSAGENQIPFELEEDVSDLEFVIRNTNDTELKVESLQVEKTESGKDRR